MASSIIRANDVLAHSVTIVPAGTTRSGRAYAEFKSYRLRIRVGDDTIVASATEADVTALKAGAEREVVLEGGFHRLSEVFAPGLPA